MKRTSLHAGLIAFLLVPVIVTGGFAMETGTGLAPGPAGSAPGIPGRSLPSLPNLSFTDGTLAAQTLYDQGFALTMEGRYSEALQAYGRALSYNRSLLNAWYYSGDALFRLGRYSEALLAFGNATAVDPDFVDAYFYESLVYERLNRSLEEKDTLRRGLEAADRRKAAVGAGTQAAATTAGPVPEPVSPGTAFLGACLAMGFRELRRRHRGS
jgi:tetratricopeptide (TPR) repeat protein